MPLRSGIETSISTTSQSPARTICTAWTPFSASPATVRSGVSERIWRRPCRTIA